MYCNHRIMEELPVNASYYNGNVIYKSTVYTHCNQKVVHLWLKKILGKGTIKTTTASKVSVFGVIVVRMRENADRNNSEYGHFLRNAR